MFKNYFKIAWRNLVKSKGYSAINIGGLAVGMAVAMLIGLWVYDEMTFDKYHKNYDRIEQVMIGMNFNGQRYSSFALPRPLEQELRTKYGRNFRHIVMSRWNEGHILSVGNKKISQTGRFMQEGAPEMLSLKMLSGNWNGLNDPHSIILSSSVAVALFGDENPMDKMMRIDNQMDVKVTGIYEDLPYNTEFKDVKFISAWDLLLSHNKWMQEAAGEWGNSSFLMYVQLQPNTTDQSVSDIIKNAKYDKVEPEGKKFNPQVFLNPMSKWHLYSEWENGINVGGRIQYVWLFGIIGFFVLLLACINFMNLSTARSEKRAKEVGIRKAIGSMRSQLVRQFLSESLMVTFIAFILAIILVIVSLSWFNELADKQMNIPWSNLYFWLISLAFIVLTGFIAGSYPALYLSSFKPVKVLKGTFRTGRFAALPRKALVVLQYTVSISLIIGTIIVYRQIQHAKNRPVGYSRNGLLMVHVKSQDLWEKFDLISGELKNNGIALATSGASSPVTAVWSNNGGFEWRNKDPDKEDGFATVWITHDYGKTIGWQFKQGRDFSPAFASDSVSSKSSPEPTRNMIINEAAAKYMNLTNPVGEIIKWDGFRFTIVGVTKDMVVESPFSPVRQTIYVVNYDEAKAYINIRLNPKISVSNALSKIEAIFKKLVPSVPFDYQFADTEYGLKFAAEERIGKLASVFATLAILISCLGLFGLASFVAEKRTKEIGVRKVLGASVYNLWKMLSKDFVVLVIISCLIAIPVARYYLHQWLEKYEYRTEISWWIFPVVVGGALMITIVTVSFQAIKAAIANPVKSLRTE
ncbi:MAG: FtsX-like permease family protein [Chitinophagaceae bacterium]